MTVWYAATIDETRTAYVWVAQSVKSTSAYLVEWGKDSSFEEAVEGLLMELRGR
jgi:hypothetical protein